MQDFEEAAKKSWQSFSTMKRFVSEANRLENASWRLWFMQKSRLQDGAAAGAATSLSAAPPSRLRVLCVYCEMHHASLSCHGCCHDAYCVSCFKLIHKKGHLATHTAVKLGESSSSSAAAASERRVSLTDATAQPCAKSSSSHRLHHHHHSHDHHQPHQQPPPPGKSPTLSPVSSSSSSVSSAASSPSASAARKQWTHPDDPPRDLRQCKTKQQDVRPRARMHKSWEIQMDTLLQRLMANSIHHESDIRYVGAGCDKIATTSLTPGCVNSTVFTTSTRATPSIRRSHLHRSSRIRKALRIRRTTDKCPTPLRPPRAASRVPTQIIHRRSLHRHLQWYREKQLQ
ncbi:hypothetical protein PINS_up014039 [Pythium insidiosum]|nr:hypothetical protein PINS_up014039 [Pythium insidiosum]